MNKVGLVAQLGVGGGMQKAEEHVEGRDAKQKHSPPGWPPVCHLRTFRLGAHDVLTVGLVASCGGQPGPGGASSRVLSELSAGGGRTSRSGSETVTEGC